MVLFEDIVGKKMQEQITTTLNEQSFPRLTPHLIGQWQGSWPIYPFSCIFEDEEMKGTSFVVLTLMLLWWNPTKAKWTTQILDWGNLIFVFWICWSKIIEK
jgi:hypothetical protein